MTRAKRFLILLLATASALGLLPLASLCGIVLCSTASVPPGLYRAIPGPLLAGDTVIVCFPEDLGREALALGRLPERIWRSCPGGVGPAVKILAATGGDRVSVRTDGLWVNGFPFAQWTYRQDPRRPLELPKSYQLAPEEIWVHGNHPRSWDSRHFGPIPRDHRTSRARPLWTVKPPRRR